MNQLPEAITLGRLLTTFNLKVSVDSSTFVNHLRNLAIRSLHLLWERDFILLLPGHEISLKPSGDFIEGKLPSLYPKNTFKLECPANFCWPAFCAAVGVWLEREQGRILAASETYSEKLMERFAQGHGFNSLQSLKVLLGYDIFLLDRQLNILAWFGGNTIPAVPTAFVSPKQAVVKSVPLLSTSMPLFEGKWQDQTYRTTPLTWYPISGAQGALGYLGIIAKQDDIGSVEHLFLYKTAALLFMELVKTKSVQENERQHYRDFLYDLLYNNFESEEVIRSRGKLWGWDFTLPHLVLVGELPECNPHCAKRDWLQDLVIEITRTFKRSGLPAICTESNDQLVLLFPQSQVLKPTQWRPTAEKLLEPVMRVTQNLLKNSQLLFGLGNLCLSAKDIHRSFQEAKAALELGKLLNLEGALTTFHDLGVMRLLYRLDFQELTDFRTEILGPLLKFDTDSNLNLEETLIAYFTCNADLNCAAQKLFLHPNTLRYRLKKAAEILCMDLSELENQFNICIALKIGRLKPFF